MEVLDKKFRNELRLLGMESSMSSEETAETGKALTDALSTLDVAKNQIDSLFSKLEEQEGWFSNSQTVPNDALEEARNIGEVLNRMSTGRGMPGVLDAKKKLKQNGIWSRIPSEQREKFNRVIGITQTVGGLSKEASTSEYADVLRTASERYREIQDFSPMQSFNQETAQSVLGDQGTEDESDDSSDQPNTDASAGNRFDQNLNVP
jgi:phage tail sheath protein FI